MKKSMLILLIIAVVLIIMTGFFVFTVTKSSPTQITLYEPTDDGKAEENKYGDTRSKLTLILLKNDKVFGYYGDFINGGQTVSIDKTSDLINNGWKMFSKDSLVIVIKPSKDASYKATVDVLDAMAINNVNRYTMVDIDKKEKEFLKIDG